MTARGTQDRNDSQLAHATRCPLCGHDIPPAAPPPPHRPEVAGPAGEQPCPSCGAPLGGEGPCPRCAGATAGEPALSPGDIAEAVRAVLDRERARLGHGFLRGVPRGKGGCPSCLVSEEDAEHEPRCELSPTEKLLRELSGSLSPPAAPEGAPGVPEASAVIGLVRRGREAIRDGYLWTRPQGRFCVACAGNESDRHTRGCEIGAAAELVEELVEAADPAATARIPGTRA